MKILLSPSEGDLSKKFGQEAMFSPIPEEKGADILLYSEHGLFAFQRKKCPTDFLLSVEDGRLTRELALLKECPFRRLIAEEKFKYWYDGTLDLGFRKVNGKKVRIPSHYTRSHILGIMSDIEFVHGVPIRQTEDIDETVDYIRSVIRLLTKVKHTGLYSRPSAKGNWYVPSAKDLHLWILQSFPGIGPSLADAIITQFGGEIPLKWTCTAEQLAQVPRLPRKKAYELIDSLSAGKLVKKGDVESTNKDKDRDKDQDSKFQIMSQTLEAFSSLRAKLGR